MSEQQKKDTGYDVNRKDSNKKTKFNNQNELQSRYHWIMHTISTRAIIILHAIL